MQEEVENRTVNLAISTTKLTFRTIVNGYNAWKRHHQAKVAQKTSQLPIGKQSIKELIGQNQGVSSIPIEKTDLKGFEQVARKIWGWTWKYRMVQDAFYRIDKEE